MKIHKLRIALKKAQASKALAMRELHTASTRAQSAEENLAGAKRAYKMARKELKLRRKESSEGAALHKAAKRSFEMVAAHVEKLERKLRKAEKKLGSKPQKGKTTPARNKAAAPATKPKPPLKKAKRP